MTTIREKILLDIETSFDDDESFNETLLYCVNEDLQDCGFTLHSSDIVDETTEYEIKVGRALLKALKEKKHLEMKYMNDILTNDTIDTLLRWAEMEI